jgi:hypothetical protein
MITLDFITALFYEIDEQLRAIPKHPEAHLWPSEVVTLESREMLGVMPPQASPEPQYPCLDTNA